MKYYLKELHNMKLHLSVQVPWIAVEGNNGIVATDNPQIISALDGLIAGKRGGVSDITKAEYDERKKNPARKSRVSLNNLWPEEGRLQTSPVPFAGSSVAAAGVKEVASPPARRGQKTPASQPTTAKGVLGLAGAP